MLTFTNSVAILIGMQVATLGWRINREIAVGDEGRKTWFPVSDILNLIMMVLLILGIVNPMKMLSGDIKQTVLSVGFIIMGMHPINMIAHYRLMTKLGRSIYEVPGKDYPYTTGIEKCTLVITILLVSGYIATHILYDAS